MTAARPARGRSLGAARAARSRERVQRESLRRHSPAPGRAPPRVAPRLHWCRAWPITAGRN